MYSLSNVIITSVGKFVWRDIMQKDFRKSEKTMDLVHSGSQIKALDHGELKDTSKDTIELYLSELNAKAYEWAQAYPIKRKIKLLESVLANIEKYKEEWIKLDLIARRIPEGHPDAVHSIVGTAGGSMLSVRLTLEILKKIEAHGAMKPFVGAHQDGDRVVIESFPRNQEDAREFPGFKGQIHLMRGTKVEDLPALQAAFYKNKNFKGAVCLILAAGNFAKLAVEDILQKMFVENRVIILKDNPVLEYMGPLMEKVLEPLIKEGVLRIVVGGVTVGKLLVEHPMVDEIHMTGSDKTFETIVYGPGSQGQENKKINKPVTNKHITAELGNVAPVIVVPGEWLERDYDSFAKELVGLLVRYNGYACTTPRTLILSKNWKGSAKIVERIIHHMEKATPPVNYYPGTNRTFEEAKALYPQATQIGTLEDTKQPVMFIKGLDAKDDEVAFRREFWGTILSQVYLEGDSPEEFLRNAVEFANKKLWGTLAATLYIDPNTEKKLEAKQLLKKAIDDLKYGTVTINIGSGWSIAIGVHPWGGYPGSSYQNIQSGNTFVHNVFMLDKIEKCVLHAPFRKV